MSSVDQKVHTLILDLDGPLLDSSPRHYACYSTILRELGAAPLPLDQYWALKRERAGLAAQLGASAAAHLQAEFARRWLDLIERPEFLALDAVQPGVPAKLRELRGMGLNLVVVTLRREASHLEVQLSRLGLSDLLDKVVVVPHGEGAAGKAHRLRAALPALDPTACLWVGDTEVDVEAASLFGCPIWAVSCGVRSAGYLAALGPNALLPDLTAIALRGPNGN